LYLYGYLNRINSSGQLAKEAKRNVELMWLLNNIRPKKRVLYYFRENNSEAIKKVFREFNNIYKKLGLFGNETIAVDSVKIRADNGKKNNYTKNGVETRVKQLNESIDKYLSILSEADKISDNENESEINISQIKDIISSLQEKKQKYEVLKEEITNSKEEQVSKIDKDSRLMSQGSGKGLNVSYNTQVVVEEKNKLIIEYETTNQANDLGRLENITKNAKEFLETDKITVLADSGYFDSDDILKCEGQGTTCIIPPAKRSSQSKDSKYSIEFFKFDKSKDVFICPENTELRYMREREKEGKKYHVYSNYSACRICKNKDQCTKAKKGREIQISANHILMEEIRKRYKENRKVYNKRLSIVEHPFGTIKWTWGFNRYQTRGFEKVGAENALLFTAYNLRRVINIVGIKKLIEAIRSLFYKFILFHRCFLKKFTIKSVFES
jgi:hypothetical protein